ncbi:MAG: hypothetical protein M5U12_36380 [Verrucomicrobia bacterium]|nr:hypothetical protein [Verrucomicrobiota bacterium]
MALLAGYSVISYKTPWCVLGFLHGLILLAGVGAAALFRWIRPTWGIVLVFLVVVAGTVQLGSQAWRASRTMATDQRNPYVYAHTSRDFMRLVNRVLGIAAVEPQPTRLGINVMVAGATTGHCPGTCAVSRM